MRDSRSFAIVIMAVASLVPAQRSLTDETDEPIRDYALGARSASFYRLQHMQLTGIGLSNEETAYFATTESIKRYKAGKIDMSLPVHGGKISAFHLCHHRNSFFYEVFEDGSAKVFEHNVERWREKPDEMDREEVWHSLDADPASSLACVDKYLLRASEKNLLAIDVDPDPPDDPDHHQPELITQSELLHYGPHEEGRISSVAVGFAASVVSKANIVAAVRGNRTLVRLHLSSDSNEVNKVHAEVEPLLPAGDGSDGAMSDASTYDPRYVASMHGAVVFTDGCAVRQIADGRVKTLIGMPSRCTAPQNETVEPVPWASALSKAFALAGAAEETADSTVLALTGSNVVKVTETEDSCKDHSEQHECITKEGCAWASGAKTSQRLCFSCEDVKAWMGGQSEMDDVCMLEARPRAGTYYNLVGCGCVAPTPEPGSSDFGLTAFQIIVGCVVIMAACCLLTMLHRASRRAAAPRELYDDCAEFHIFTDCEEDR